jgi:peroxiredoxin
VRYLAAATLLAGAAVGPAEALTTRHQTRLEIEYVELAKGSRLPQFCERIYPGATGGAGFNPRGSQSWFTRSLCYYDLAIATGNPIFCDQVHPYSTLFTSGSDYSASECRKKVARPEPRSGPPMNLIISVKPILLTMGYTEAKIPQVFLREVNEWDMWMAFLESVAGTPDFAARIDRLPDFSKVAAPTNTTTCEAPYILGGWAMGEEGERDCCLDVNRNGRCDAAEFGGDPASATDLVVEVTPGKPPRNLCGDRSFDVEVVVQNRGRVPIRAGSGYITLLPVNPAAFGLAAADFFKLLPDIPPDGSARVQFAALRYRYALSGPGEHMPMQAMVCLSKPSAGCSKAIPLGIERRPADASECKAAASLHTASGSCEAPYMTDPKPAAGEALCCLDVDGDRRCDERQWETSRARPESIRIAFQKNPRPTFEEGAVFFLPVTVRNEGTTPIGGGDGFIRLERDPRLVTVASESDLVVPLPAVPPGREAMVLFPGLRFVPPNAQSTETRGEFSATLCMRGGCSSKDRVTATFRAKDADRKLAERKARVAARASARPGVPWPMIGADGAVTRSTLDPEALVVVGRPAPDFSTTDSSGRFFRLISLRGKTNAVLVFCPGSGTAPACEARLASLQSAGAELARRDAQVFVVSGWEGAAPAWARQRTRPGISWLSDPRLKISACYARRAAGETATPRPMVVIIDKQGKVVRALDDPRGTQPPTADLVRSIGPAPAPASNPPEGERR